MIVPCRHVYCTCLGASQTKCNIPAQFCIIGLIISCLSVTVCDTDFSHSIAICSVCILYCYRYLSIELLLLILMSAFKLLPLLFCCSYFPVKFGKTGQSVAKIFTSSYPILPPSSLRGHLSLQKL